MKGQKYIALLFFTLSAFIGLGQASLDTICTHQPPSHLAVPYQPNLVYHWNVGQGNIISKPDSNVITVDWSSAGAGHLPIWVVGVDTASGCVGDTSRSSLLITSPQNPATAVPATICEGEWAVLESTTSGPFKWQNGSTKPVIQFRAYRDTSVYLVSLNGECDNDTIHFNVDVLFRPEAGMSQLADTVERNSSITLMYDGYGSSDTHIEWFLNGYSEGVGQAVNLTFEKTGWNELAQLVSDGFCADTLWKDIYVDDGFAAHFPNSFTPNADGLNDYWIFSGVGHQRFTAEIFDRWGAKVFSWNENSVVKGWDGTKNGHKAMAGAYVYIVRIVDYRGNEHVYRDHFTLIR